MYRGISWNNVWRMSLSNHLTSLILNCVSDMSLTVVRNDNRLDSFRPNKGFRQGDLLLPLFFLSSIWRSLHHTIDKKVTNGIWTPIKSFKTGIEISHLFSADDILFFYKATLDQIATNMTIPCEFEIGSGLKVNVQKSKAFASKSVPRTTQYIFNNVTDISFIQNLGFSIIDCRTNKSHFEDILHRMNKILAVGPPNFYLKQGRLPWQNIFSVACPFTSCRHINFPLRSL